MMSARHWHFWPSRKLTELLDRAGSHVRATLCASHAGLLSGRSAIYRLTLAVPERRDPRENIAITDGSIRIVARWRPRGVGIVRSSYHVLRVFPTSYLASPPLVK